MIQSRRRLGFTTEALQGFARFGNRIGKEFQRDMAFQAQILRLIHHAHSAAAELLYYAVVGNSRAYQVKENIAQKKKTTETRSTLRFLPEAAEKTKRMAGGSETRPYKLLKKSTQRILRTLRFI